MNLKGPQRAATHGEMLHAPSMHTHVWAMLSSALHVLYRFRSNLPAVHSAYKLDPNVRLRIVLVADLQGFKDGTSRRCWWVVSQKGSTHTNELSQYFCSNTWPLYVRMLSACYNQYPTEYSSFVSRYEQKYFMAIMRIIAIITCVLMRIMFCDCYNCV